MDEKKSYADLSLLDIAKITRGYSSGNLPLNMIVDVEVRNPNTEIAAITKTQWRAFLEDNQIAENIIDDRVEIAPNGGTTIMKVKVQSNIMETVYGEGKKDLINLMANLFGSGTEPSNLQLQLKPSIKVGAGSVNYPGYIKVNKTFGAE
jgi:LEA14-like dessication related protein